MEDQDLTFTELGMVYAEETYRTNGNIKSPIVIYEDDDGVITPYQIDTSSLDTLEEDFDLPILATVEKLIQDKKPERICVIYQAFLTHEESGKAYRLLMSIFYSDEGMQAWTAPLNGNAVGDWQEVPEDTPLYGYEDLWKRATAQRRN